VKDKATELETQDLDLLKANESEACLYQENSKKRKREQEEDEFEKDEKRRKTGNDKSNTDNGELQELSREIVKKAEVTPERHKKCNEELKKLRAVRNGLQHELKKTQDDKADCFEKLKKSQARVKELESELQNTQQEVLRLTPRPPTSMLVVTDTNMWLRSLNDLSKLQFEKELTVIIPVTVGRELDKLKMDEFRCFSANKAIKKIAELYHVPGSNFRGQMRKECASFKGVRATPCLCLMTCRKLPLTLQTRTFCRAAYSS
jgi:hypothetical protein